MASNHTVSVRIRLPVPLGNDEMKIPQYVNPIVTVYSTLQAKRKPYSVFDDNRQPNLLDITEKEWEEIRIAAEKADAINKKVHQVRIRIYLLLLLH